MTPTEPRPAALLLTPVLPLPGGSGRSMRAWDWLVELARNYRVHVIVCGPLPEGWTPEPGYPATTVRSIAAQLRPPSPTERKLGLLLPFLTPLSRHLVLDWLIPHDGWPDRSAVPEGETVERIVVFRAYLHEVAARLFDLYPDAARTLDMDDLESRTRLSVGRALLRLGRVKEALFVLASAAQYRSIEAHLCGPYHETFLASPEDAARLKRRIRRSIADRPNRVAVQDDPAPLPKDGPLQLLFVGSLDYVPNEEAARQLATQLAPLLQQRLNAPWTITIVGRNASPELHSLLRNNPGIRHIDDAEDLAPLYATSRIVLVPLRSGGGTKIKFLEALAYRRPVIATREGVGGIAAMPSQHYFAAETPAEFADVIGRLASGELNGSEVAEAGWHLCRDRYGRSSTHSA